MSKRAFEKKIEALKSLRSAPTSPSTLDQLRHALKERNNYLVSTAAALAGEFGLPALVPDLVAAFDRFLIDAPKSDPQCWAKNAIAKALKDLSHHDPAVFLRGSAHVQLEPVWGGRQDTAATLRGTCALALVECSLDRMAILTRLVDLLADPEKLVRIDAARAIAQFAAPESVLLLRLKAAAGDREPEVTGQCLVSLLDLSPRDALPFVAGFLDAEEPDVRFEAVAALGECREPEAVDILTRCWGKQKDPELRRAILRSLGASRQPAAIEFLLSIVDQALVADAATSIAALAAGRFREDVRERVADAVRRRGDPALATVFQKEF